MSIKLKMPALSPTMETATLAKWLVAIGDLVKAGDPLAEVETDKATMEVEAVEEGRIVEIIIPEGTDDVAVGATIALLSDASVVMPVSVGPTSEARAAKRAHMANSPSVATTDTSPEGPPATPPTDSLTVHQSLSPVTTDISPLAARLSRFLSINLDRVSGSGPKGQIVKADLGLQPVIIPTVPSNLSTPAMPTIISEIPHVSAKLSNMRKTIARRLTESKQSIPHIYLTVDIDLDALLKLRLDLNDGLKERNVRLSVNDILIKALALALIDVPSCNVMLAGDRLVTFERADISVAVSVPAGLITPVVRDASNKSLSAIATETKDLAYRAQTANLLPNEYQGGTATLSNMGMFGIKQFDAVINPPQGMILAIGAGEKRPIVINDEVTVATALSATGSFDHRTIDGTDAAKLMRRFKELVEEPLSLIV